MGYWHAVLARRLAEALTARGATVIVAASDPGLVSEFLPDTVTLVQAPFHVPPDHVLRGLRTRSFADILGAAGWRDATVLAGLVRAWDGVFTLARADRLVADHAPTALLAARGRVPAMRIGLGFTLPPSDADAFPVLVDTAPCFDDHALVANAAGPVLRRTGKALARLPQALEAEATAVTCLGELDPYRAQRRGAMVGPLEVLPSPSPAPPEGPIVAYLVADDPRTTPALAGLVATRRPVIAHVRDARAEAIAGWQAAGIEVHVRPLDFVEAVRGAALVVHHGGAGACHVAATAGRPQLLLPRHLEQELNARALERLGVGRRATDVGAGLTGVAMALLGAEPRAAAQRWATVAYGNVDPDAAGALADRIMALTAGEAPP